MIETPAAYPDYPRVDLRSFGATPLADDEPCPILFRDAGPDGVGRFLEGTLTTLAGREAPVVFLRSAEVPCSTRAAGEFGELILLRPMALHPWRTSEAGVYVAPRDASPVGVGFVPPGTDRRAIPPSTSGEVELRELFGGATYDDLKSAALERIHTYREERAFVEAVLRRVPDRRDLERAGLTEAELFGPWFEVAPDRRKEIREILGHFSP